MRGRDFWLAVQQAGAGALPIIGVISFLVGMIQAFVGGSQLALFGAADLRRQPGRHRHAPGDGRR